MDDLFAVTITPESVLSERFRIHAVTGDAMEPGLRGGRDYVITAPVTTYRGEGIYLVDTGLGIELFRVTNTLKGAELQLSRDNQRYAPRLLDRDKFNDWVVAIVIADIRTRDQRFL
jgi:phage repressor protein C with HTH and peptisase S24 domain